MMCVLTSLRCCIFEGIHLGCLFISSQVRNIEAHGLSSISWIERPWSNSYINCESIEFLKGCGMSSIGKIY